MARGSVLQRMTGHHRFGHLCGLNPPKGLIFTSTLSGVLLILTPLNRIIVIPILCVAIRIPARCFSFLDLPDFACAFCSPSEVSSSQTHSCTLTDNECPSTCIFPVMYAYLL